MKEVVLLFLIVLFLDYTDINFARGETVTANCDLFGYGSNSMIGFINFTQEVSSDEVTINGCVERLAAGKKGIHIHQFGVLSPYCLYSGGHFNPEDKSHGGISDEERHVGDLGNIFVERYSIDPFCFPSFTDNLISLLPGKNNIIGRTLAIHKDEDDLGRGSHDDSKTIGHSGARVACCVIGLASEIPSYLISHQPTAVPHISLVLFSILYTILTKGKF